jgi:hypothetical protein
VRNARKIVILLLVFELVIEFRDIFDWDVCLDMKVTVVVATRFAVGQVKRRHSDGLLLPSGRQYSPSVAFTLPYVVVRVKLVVVIKTFIPPKLIVDASSHTVTGSNAIFGAPSADAKVSILSTLAAEPHKSTRVLS